jgi:hypothetical protein
MWYLDTPRAVLAQVGNASPWAKETENLKILGVAFKNTAHMGDGRSVLLTLRKKPKIEIPGEWQRRVIRGAEQRMTP